MKLSEAETQEPGMREAQARGRIRKLREALREAKNDLSEGSSAGVFWREKAIDKIDAALTEKAADT